MEGDKPYLPPEIMMSILARLPVKSIVRFRCVSKEWMNLFQTKDFIQEHFEFSRRNPLLLIEGYEPLHPDEGQVMASPVPDDWAKKCALLGPCNGLLCLDGSVPDNAIILWNPAIREHRIVPRPAFWQRDETIKLGLGYNSGLNDYNIVSIAILDKDKLVFAVDVYSLRAASWKKVEYGNLGPVTVTSCGRSFNESIYWFGFNLHKNLEDGETRYLLVSYNIASELFQWIPLPISAPTKYDSDVNRLATHDNKLAFLSHTTVGDLEYSLIDMWVLGGNSTTSMEWTKKFTLSHPSLLLPRTIWNNEIVCHYKILPGRNRATTPRDKKSERTIVLINLFTHSLKRMFVHNYGHRFGMLNYVESLVPLGEQQWMG